MRTLSIFYAVVGWGIVVLGSLHMISTLRLLNSTPVFRLWFFGAGMAVIAGALTTSSLVERTLVVGLIGSALILSFIPSAWNGGMQPQNT